MARNLARSSSGWDSSSASARTRALKSNQDSSRLKYRSSGRLSTAAAALVAAGGADGTLRSARLAGGGGAGAVVSLLGSVLTTSHCPALIASVRVSGRTRWLTLDRPTGDC